MINIDMDMNVSDLKPQLEQFFDISGKKIVNLANSYDPDAGAPVFTVAGKYTSRGWTEWTQGFQFGMMLLQFDATGNSEFLDIGRGNTTKHMPGHVTHFGVHDHGFNNISTFGNLLRLMNEGKIPENQWERNYYELALKCSGAVQAKRWTQLPNDGYIYSFNGPHSLFADTVRSLRALAVSHQLGHCISGENDTKISLLERLVQHASTTAEYNVYYGNGRDHYDLRGRVAHESIFNLNDGNYRCPNSQQGFSPFTTWTRGLAWILCGYPEQLEFIDTLEPAELEPAGGKENIKQMFLKTATATADFYINHTPNDGIPYWDTGAPLLHKLGNYLDRPSNPYNDYEPVDSSAAAISAQGLLRLGNYLGEKKYTQAGLTVMKTLLDKPYISDNPEHQGLILHSIYHRPNGWDYIPEGSNIPCGESSMWGDYHVMEAALYLLKQLRNEPYLKFFI